MSKKFQVSGALFIDGRGFIPRNPSFNEKNIKGVLECFQKLNKKYPDSLGISFTYMQYKIIVNYFGCSVIAESAFGCSLRGIEESRGKE
ncbi:hypothetical protein KAR91_70345 [Candidatus Pacearchaeota archaeon]|nr:hypothetical protein [Candidatus Pacearchaeota archaeon]